jgi:hypothetical protein
LAFIERQEIRARCMSAATLAEAWMSDLRRASSIRSNSPRSSMSAIERAGGTARVTTAPRNKPQPRQNTANGCDT